MPWLPGLTELLHVIAAIAWLGTALTTELVVFPLADRLPPAERARALLTHSLAEKRVIRPAVAAVIVLGILRGTVWGPIRSLDVFATPYGLTWLFALALTIGLYLWGRLVITSGYIALGRLAATEPTDEALLVAMARIKRVRRQQLVGFVVILAAMVAMGFGL